MSDDHADRERSNYRETIGEAKRIAEALLLSQVGDVNAMASMQTLESLERLKANEVLAFATIRVLVGVGVAFATGAAAEYTARGTPAFDAKSAELLRWVIDKLEYTVNE